MRTLLLLLVLSVLLPVAAGCASPRGPAPVRDYRLAEDYEARRPVDVAVLAPSGDLPRGVADDLRAAARAFLLDRRYAPVREKEIDRDPGLFRPGGPNAVLEIRILRWDESRMAADGGIRVDAEARLFGTGSMNVLYVSVLRDVVITTRGPAQRDEDRPQARMLAARLLADDLLERLPVKADG